MRPHTRPKTTTLIGILTCLLPLVLFSCGGSGSGGSDSLPQGNNPPSIGGTVNPATGETGTTPFSFSTAPSDPDGDTVQVRVDYEGDGNWDIAYATQSTFSHIFPAAGTYTARMQAKDSLGAESTVVNFPSVTVNDPSPTNQQPSITGTVSPSSGERGITSFHYVLSPSDPNGDSTTVRIDYEGDSIWDTGYVSQTSFTHTFSSAGTYTGKMQARDSKGAESGVLNFNSVTVNDPPPANSPPTISTLAATSVGATTATLNGTVNPNGLETNAWFEWGTNPNLTNPNNTPTQNFVAGTTSQAISVPLFGLIEGMQYFFRLVASNSEGENKSAITSFNTLPIPPAVNTLTATGITTTGATLNGTVNPNGVAAEAWFQYGTDPSFTSFAETAHQALGPGTTGQSVSSTVSMLTPWRTYYFRMVASHDGGTQKGTMDSFPTGEYFVAVGDSITRGSHDDYPADDISLDGRNTGGGYEPILNNLLTKEKGYPHTVVNEGISGDTSAEGVVQIATTLSNHPSAKYYLVMYGTNDAWFPAVPSGLGLNPGDEGYSGSYKDSMQRIISAILAAGRTPYLAKVPYATVPGIDISAIQNYNLVVEELIFDNDIWVIPPDFFAYFQDPLYIGELDDGVHPNGLGYQSMADLWFDALTAP